MNDILAKLNKALKSGGTSSAGTLIHENEIAILDAATQLLAKSETGRELLNFARDRNVKMHVLKNKQDFGVLPDNSDGISTVYISCPAGIDMPPARAALHLAGALRQAWQETTDALKRPENPHIPQEQFVQIHVEKDRDTIFYQCAVTYELEKVNGLSEIVDELAAMGYLELYEAYKEDMKSQGF